MPITDHEIKQRDREIAQNEEVRKNVGAVRVSTWAMAIALLIGITTFGWLLAR